MGELKKYDQVFDLDAWRKIKFSYLCEIRLMYGREPYATDNINFAISNGVKIPNYFVAVVVTVFTKGKRFIKFIKRKLRRQ